MLRMFAHPVDTLKSEPDIRTLSGIGVRAYWQGKNHEDVIMTWYMPGSRPTNGHYEVFKINRDTYKMEDTASLTIIGADKVSIFIKPVGASEFGQYSWNDTKLNFKWKGANDDLTGVGNSWELLSLYCSQSLRLLDRHISDAEIMQEIMRSEGFDYDERLQVADVIISREKCTFAMKSGLRYSVATTKFPFLKTISPTEPVVVCRHQEQNKVYAIWPTLQQSIPFDLFSRE